MLMRFRVMMVLGKILVHIKFYQVWLDNSQEKWICRLGWPFGKGNIIRMITTLGFLKTPFEPMDAPPSSWEPPWTQSHHTPMGTVTLFSLPLGCGSTHAHLRPLNHRSSVPQKIDFLQKKYQLIRLNSSFKRSKEG